MNMNDFIEVLKEKNVPYSIDGDRIFVNGSLGLGDTSISSLPDNLNVSGSLDLRDASITSLPDNLSVDGSLGLEKTCITRLPNNLKVDGFIYLHPEKITNIAYRKFLRDGDYTVFAAWINGECCIVVNSMIYTLGEFFRSLPTADVAQAARECVAELTQRGEMEHCRLMKYCNTPLSETPNAMRLLQKLMDAGYSAREIAQAALAEEARRAENKQVRVWRYEICDVDGNWDEDETPHKPDEEMFVVRNVRPIFFGEYTESENRTTWLNVEAFFALLNSRHIDYTVRENGAVVVHGYLDLEGTGITTLPDNLSVGGYLYLSGSGITTLPDNLSVGDGLNLSNTNITTLPDNLSVGGHLSLSNTGITILPNNLSVGGDLYLRGTGITTLPDNLSVGGGLNLSNTNITTLPGNLSVSGHLNLSNTGITTLPDNLSVGGYLDLEGTGITTLPDNLSVSGYLDLSGTGIITLPDNLSVGGDLYLRGTRITVIPSSVHVGGAILTGTFRAGTDGGAA